MIDMIEEHDSRFASCSNMFLLTHSLKFVLRFFDVKVRLHCSRYDVQHEQQNLNNQLQFMRSERTRCKRALIAPGAFE